MDKVSIHHLSAGMVLDQDVKDPGGRLLAPSGQEVSEKLIRVFKIWGVGEIRVKASEEPEAANSPGAEIQIGRAHV